MGSETKTPARWADLAGGNAVVVEFLTLGELAVLGPVWIREMLKRRPRVRGRMGGVVALGGVGHQPTRPNLGSSDSEGGGS